ncbi:probable enoyl-CoA hydratase [Neodiprion pinetum]|uniref:probable enoyl-CoA hydratase n=1 Tax=Neodiprion fabricii TaxID=2872261 RepID=UPI001ED9069F|nr:probable enoyl-CoA hydratase [Neodiprion fabricii]XP_046492645.1 probable enoyl-CoA hydratase [Neodiprion pinetum]
MFSARRLIPSLSREIRRHLKKSLTSKPAAAVELCEPTKENKDILVERMGEITKIGINCPEKKNSLNRIAAQNLSDAIEEFEQDESALVAVIHGIGGNFCTGYDLKEISEYDGESEDTLPQFGPLANRMTLTKKPMVAALSGYTIGAGLELALLCDLRVVEESAVIGFHNRRFGVPILGGGTVRLPALIGHSRAMDMILTGRGITAAEAFSWGLANRLVACGTSLGQAFNLAQCLLKFPQRTMLADRASAHNASFSSRSFEEALQYEKDHSSHLLLEEGAVGAKKFREGIGRHGKFYHLRPIDRSKTDEIKDDLL